MLCELMMRPASNLRPARDEPDETVFDRARFLSNVDGDVELLREFAQLFLEDGPQRLRALHDALDRRDRHGLETAAHTLKGSAGYIGASLVFAAADELETIARSGDLADAASACAKLYDATAQLLQILAAMC